LFITCDGQTVFDVNRAVVVFVLICEVNEIIDAVKINVARYFESVGLMTKRKINAVGAFAFEILIAYFKSYVSDVRSVVIKFFERGRTVGIRVIDDKRAALPEREIYAERAGKSEKIAV
jgi:hypothetical protein